MGCLQCFDGESMNFKIGGYSLEVIFRKHALMQYRQKKNMFIIEAVVKHMLFDGKGVSWFFKVNFMMTDTRIGLDKLAAFSD